MKCSITIKGNSLFFYARPGFWYQTTFTLPAGTDPQQLHATLRKGPNPKDSSIGQVVVAIVKIEDGVLSLAVNQDPQGPVPNTFVVETNSMIVRYDLKKVQPQEKNVEKFTPK